jgi:hypothetical protein
MFFDTFGPGTIVWFALLAAMMACARRFTPSPSETEENQQRQENVGGGGGTAASLHTSV